MQSVKIKSNFEWQHKYPLLRTYLSFTLFFADPCENMVIVTNVRRCRFIIPATKSIL